MRDPLKDPRPGDVVLYGPPWQRERASVVGRDGGDVQYRVGGAEVWCLLSDWQAWMRGAEVIRRAEEVES